MLSSCIGDKTIYDEEDVPSFSELPFDHIILVSHTGQNLVPYPT